MTTRVNILNRIESDLKALSDLQEVLLVRKPIVFDLDNVKQPAAIIYPGPDRKIKTGGDAVIGKENWLWTIFIEVWAIDTDMEDLLSVIHSALFNDFRLGGFAETSEREAVTMWVIDPEESQQAMLLEFSVLYRHERGIM